MAAYRFVGRARSTGDDGPRERRVIMPDGKAVWAEEGSILWDWALGREGALRCTL